jgi:uncharacterized protein YjgD (DUF1641 family)
VSSSSNKTIKAIKARGAAALASISGSALSSANNMPMLSSISERLSILLPLNARQLLSFLRCVVQFLELWMAI